MEPLRPGKAITQPSLNIACRVAPKLSKACRYLPTNSSFSPLQHIVDNKLAWKILPSVIKNDNANPKHQFLSNREQMQFQSKTKKALVVQTLTTANISTNAYISKH